MFDKGYFDTYAADIAQWQHGYERRRYTYRGVVRSLGPDLERATAVAEFGCGLGMFSYHLLQRRPQLHVDAFDISEYAVDVARKMIEPFANASVRVGDAQDTGLASEAYDVVVALDVVEHLPEPEKLVREAFRVLRPGGVLYLSTPNPDSVGARIKRARAAAHAPAELPLAQKWFADRDPTHVNIRSMEAWREVCRGAGFTLVRQGTDGLWDTPYLRYVPTLLQKVVGNGGQRTLLPLFGMLPWTRGENYLAAWRKP